MRMWGKYVGHTVGDLPKQYLQKGHGPNLVTTLLGTHVRSCLNCNSEYFYLVVLEANS